jgi:hypothetical protein
MERPRNPGDDVVHLIAGRDNSRLRHEGFATGQFTSFQRTERRFFLDFVTRIF